MDAALSLDRHGLLGRFDAPVEADYQRWLELHLYPLALAMAYSSLVAWLVTVPAAFLFARDDLNIVLVVVVCWGVNAGGILVGTAWARRNHGRSVVALGTLGIGITAVDSIAILGPAMDADPMVYLAGGLFYGLLAPMTQVPLRQCAFLGVLICGLTATFSLTHPDQHWDVQFTAVFVTCMAGTLGIGLAMAWTAERGNRSIYAAEKTIEHQRTLIRRYAPSTVVSRIEQGDTTVDSPQRRKVTVFFSDVVGFTEMADRVDPEALAAIVNDYLGSLADLIERHGGTLNEFAGDGVMAIFGAPDHLEPADQVRAALAAAQELQRSLPAWSQGWYQHGIVEDAQARIGINTGTLSVGTFGSAVRATYTGIGLQTNIAARVQAQAEPGGILLSNTSWHLVKDTIACEPRGEVMVKGVHFPIELYEPRIPTST
ncbi:adenylate/guanylate cyclase domain-containing protein [Nocardioides marmorisolisilvae]|uniref:Adenylate/guanylate cyclase domain-containing protein n=1 Tax=Nocardioides marmorisolisilvae TaxID=1542737 RepID=A0A3N0DWI8_9ACTN|nr:adenylate/guanylate cyclase domain-containing protein [Nocardioides marmorisolisilvae]RNL79965.1 adenylate/guanylate cyclase domain-containing protein [Nocardioides marmorisolisilvae]